MSSTSSRSGAVAVIGRPNVGKSTLVNALVGAKISITSNRPQTTRHRLLGIATFPRGQLQLVDTPGIHGEQGKRPFDGTGGCLGQLQPSSQTDQMLLAGIQMPSGGILGYG